MHEVRWDFWKIIWWKKHWPSWVCVGRLIQRFPPHDFNCSKTTPTCWRELAHKIADTAYWHHWRHAAYVSRADSATHLVAEHYKSSIVPRFNSSKQHCSLWPGVDKCLRHVARHDVSRNGFYGFRSIVWDRAQGRGWLFSYKYNILCTSTFKDLFHNINP